jgi:hypothetical protein
MSDGPEKEQDNASKILRAFDDCTACGVSCLYIPEETVGYIIARAMAMRSEIDVLRSKLESFEKEREEQISNEVRH